MFCIKMRNKTIVLSAIKNSYPPNWHYMLQIIENIKKAQQSSATEK